MVFILDPFLISPPDGLDSAQIRPKFWLQFLRLMALPVIEESSYLDYDNDSFEGRSSDSAARDDLHQQDEADALRQGGELIN